MPFCSIKLYKKCLLSSVYGTQAEFWKINLVKKKNVFEQLQYQLALLKSYHFGDCKVEVIFQCWIFARGWGMCKM